MSEASFSSTEIPAASQSDGWADMAGMIASIGCAIHCAAMPLVLAYLPTFGLSWLADEGFHQWMAVVCFALAAMAFVPGWRKHGSFVPAIWGAAGVLLLSTAAFGMECSCCPSQEFQESTSTASSEQQCEDETCEFCVSENCIAEKSSTETESTSSGDLAWLTPLVTPLGGLLLVLGHVMNHRKSCSCRGDSCCFESVDAEQSHANDR